MTNAVRQRLWILTAGNAVLLGLIFLLLKPGSSFAQVLTSAGPNVAPMLVTALGLSGVIYTGAIDLSLASILVMAGTVFGIAVHRHAPAPLAFAACVLTAILLSGLNGVLIRKLRLPPIIVTLAGLAAYRGLALIVADSAIPGFSGNLSVHEEIYHLPGKQYAGWILAATLAGALFWESIARRPREWLALGDSPEACRLAGLSPDGILQSAFWMQGLFLGIASLLFVTRLQAIEPARLALGFELPVIGAVILGGTNIFGGEGSYLGAALGALFLYFLGEALVFAEVNPYWREVATGGMIVGVIGLDCWLQRHRRRKEELK